MGGLLPVGCLYLMRSLRRIRADRQLSDALTLVSGALRAGRDFEHALALAVSRMSRPLSQEFRQVLLGMEVGKSCEESLDAMRVRLQLKDLDIFVAATKAMLKPGANMASFFDKLVITIRERKKVQGKIQCVYSEQGTYLRS